MKIYLIGCSCSGKTTLAKKISKKLAVKHLELDEYWWLPGWQERDADEFIELVKTELNRHQSWVIDGNYHRVRHLILPEADLIIWLNLPFYLVFWRSISRTISRISAGKKVCNGNKEGLSALFGWNSMPVWILRSFRKRIVYGKKLQANSDKVIELKSVADIKAWLNNFSIYQLRS